MASGSAVHADSLEGAPTSVLQAVPLEAVRYDTATGLVPVVVQDARSEAVLMQAYANREALKRTLATGYAWFWSRSRQAYWQKGATSGHVQRVVEVRIDCDGDAVLYRVEAAGPACHTGAPSCFFRSIPIPAAAVTPLESRGEGAPACDAPEAAEPPASLPPDAAVTSSGVEVENPSADILQALWATLDARFRERPPGSYTSYLFEQGVDKLAKKVGEEGVEVAIAAKNAAAGAAGRKELAAESADLVFHLLALWRGVGLTPGDVWAVLRERHREH
ncbi:MAG: bifunctional phosphoribosyl-AMP cyclohydrolase/phosphoribosyl-ATP diphosphatase HisIE [Alicyclobacillus sp.]|nr:bifunctional phosphoribosyl-AMP cyclohydrolase/phosphoribosyl-ATP diphosphatase HisIE [Alicyclobacillus sp.]